MGSFQKAVEIDGESAAAHAYLQRMCRANAFPHQAPAKAAVRRRLFILGKTYVVSFLISAVFAGYDQTLFRLGMGHECIEDQGWKPVLVTFSH